MSIPLGTMNQDGTRQPGFMLAQELLIRKLVSSELRCGQQLKESVLAREFGINRPSVREALSQAVGWGVVEYVPYCGYRVKDFTLDDLRAWSELREAIEPLAARRLAGCLSMPARRELEEILRVHDRAVADDQRERAANADFSFHMAVVRLCGNERFASPSNLCYFSVLFRMNCNVWQRLYYLVRGQEQKYLSHNDNFEQFHAFNDQLTREIHHRILDSVVAGDPEQAEKSTREHVAEQVANIVKIIEFLGRADIALDDFQKCRDFEAIRKRAGGLRFDFSPDAAAPAEAARQTKDRAALAIR